MIISMKDIRTNVAARVDVADSTIRPDILDPNETHDNLIRAMDVATAPVEKGAGDGSPSHGRKLYVSALHRDHSYDGELGPHGHDPGPDADHIEPSWAVDIGMVDNCDIGDNPKTRAFIKELITANKYVTKVGVGGCDLAEDEELQALAAAHNTVLFSDNDQPHIHFQSA